MASTITGSKAGITLAVMCAAMMAMLDISIVNVALSDIRASFGTPIDQIAWVSTGYMIANIVIIPLTGWFQRRFGYRLYFTASILVFTTASALCGLAWNLPSLTLFRVLQGMGGGAIIPTAQAILFTRYPKEQVGTASAFFGMAATAGPLLGPTVGGYLIDWSSWHWIFFVNLPVGLLAAFLSWTYIQEPGFERSKEPIDVTGIVLLAVGMASLQYVLEEGNRDGWWESWTIILLAAVAAVCLLTFIVHELETENPVVDLRVFRSRQYSAGTGINFLVGLVLFGSSYLFSLYCGAVMHYTAKQVGLIFLTAGATQLILMPLIGRFGSKLDGRALVGFGILAVASGLWMNAHLTDQAGFWDLAQPQMARAVGLSFIFIPVGIMTMYDIPREKTGNATGLFNVTRELGGSIGTAWMGMVVTDGTKIYSSYLAEAITPYRPEVQERLASYAAAIGTRTYTSAGVSELLLRLKCQVQALVLSFNGGFFRTTAVFLLTLGLLAFLKRVRTGQAPQGMH